MSRSQRHLHNREPRSGVTVKYTSKWKKVTERDIELSRSYNFDYFRSEDDDFHGSINSRLNCMPIWDPFENRWSRQNSEYISQLREIRSRQYQELSDLPADTFDKHFQWLSSSRNNSAVADTSDCSRVSLTSRQLHRLASSKLGSDQWVFLYFRVRRPEYIRTIEALRYNVGSAKRGVKEMGNILFDHLVLQKWTVNVHFKIKLYSPLKFAILAFTTRLGLDKRSDLYFCKDGFFGDEIAGSTWSSTDIPRKMIQDTSTCIAEGLKNGSNIYVSCISMDKRVELERKLNITKLDSSTDEDEEYEDETEDLPDDSRKSSTQKQSMVSINEISDVNDPSRSSLSLVSSSSRTPAIVSSKSSTESTHSSEGPVFGELTPQQLDAIKKKTQSKRNSLSPLKSKSNIASYQGSECDKLSLGMDDEDSRSQQEFVGSTVSRPPNIIPFEIEKNESPVDNKKEEKKPQRRRLKKKYSVAPKYISSGSSTTDASDLTEVLNEAYLREVGSGIVPSREVY